MPEPVTYVSFVCPVCDEEWVVCATPGGDPLVVVCRDCGYRVLFAWCPQCTAGGPVPLAPGEAPQTRPCPLCRAPYRIPAQVFAQPRQALRPAPPAGPSELARWFLTTLAALAGLLLAGYILSRI